MAATGATLPPEQEERSGTEPAAVSVKVEEYEEDEIPIIIAVYSLAESGTVGEQDVQCANSKRTNTIAEKRVPMNRKENGHESASVAKKKTLKRGKTDQNEGLSSDKKGTAGPSSSRSSQPRKESRFDKAVNKRAVNSKDESGEGTPAKITAHSLTAQQYKTTGKPNIKSGKAGMTKSKLMAPAKKSTRTLKNQFYWKNVDTRRYHCTKCDKDYTRSEGVVIHFETAHLKKRYKCDICKVAVYTQKNWLTVHQKTCRGDGKVLKNKKKPLKAKITKKKAKFTCTQCWKGFAEKQMLSLHRNKAHRIVPKRKPNRFPCDLCCNVYKHKTSLTVHKETIHFGRRFCCKFCNKPHLSRGACWKHEKKECSAK